MNISMNSISFMGKQEVTNSLLRAAKDAQSASECLAKSQGPRPYNFLEDCNIFIKEANNNIREAFADGSIQEVLNNFDKNSKSKMQEALAPKDFPLQFSKSNPLDLFSRIMFENAEKSGISKEPIYKFFNSIKG